MKTIKTCIPKKSTALMLGLFLSLFLFTTTAKAQEVQVKGVVKGKTYDKTEILNGANIFLKGTKTGTSSNRKGEFTFPQKLKVGDVLEISYLGFLTKKITIKEKSAYLTITLLEDENQMLGALNNNKRYKSKRHKE